MKSFCSASPCWQSFLPITTTGQVTAVKKLNRGDALTICPSATVWTDSEPVGYSSCSWFAQVYIQAFWREVARLPSRQESRGSVTRCRVTHDSRPPQLGSNAVRGEPVLNLAVNGSSLLWLSLQSWWSSWGNVQTPPRSSALPLLMADESVLPFWPVPVDTRMSLPAPPLWQTYMVTWRETETVISNYSRREGSSIVLCLVNGLKDATALFSY